MFRNLILIFICICLSHHLAAQSKKIAFGNSIYQSTDTVADLTILNNKKYIISQTIIFKGKNFFERRVLFDHHNGRIDTLCYQGYYRPSKKRRNEVVFKMDFITANTNDTKFVLRYRSKVAVLNDSTAILFGTKFHKTKNDPNARLRFYLQNAGNNKKTVDLPPEVRLNVRVPGNEAEMESILCRLDSLNDETAFVTAKTGGDSLRHMLVELSDINYIKFVPPKKMAARNLAKFTITMSLLLAGSVVILEPTPQILIPAAIFAAMSAPLAYIGRHKAHGISRLYETKENNYWLLKQQLK